MLLETLNRLYEQKEHSQIPTSNSQLPRGM